jgi:hypothetical protein
MLLAGFISNETLASTPADKVLVVSVNETGVISVGRDTIRADDLAKYIQDRLFKSYLGTGQMQSQIRVAKVNEQVPEMVINVVRQEIQEGQHRALTELCLEKYKNHFETLSRKQQAKLRKQFPVLFQSNFTSLSSL